VKPIQRKLKIGRYLHIRYVDSFKKKVKVWL